jgi:dihydroorotase-like cyclic amidohydrolase
MRAEHNYIKIPGLVDPHVHLRYGSPQKETFETGSVSAIAGGFAGGILDMPNNTVPITTPEALQEKIDRAGQKIYCDVGFYFGATAESTKYFGQIIDQVFALKTYMDETTGELLVEKAEDLNQIFASWPRKKPIVVHAEGKTLETAIKQARLNNQKLHVAHVATKEDLEMIRKAKEEGLPVTSEVTPHHLFLSEENARELGPFGLMKPTLKTRKDVDALWEGIDRGIIDIIATDHAPHTKEEKLSNNPPYGIPGLETALPLLLTAVDQGKLTLDQVVKLTSTNPKRIFGIRESPETFIEVDSKDPWVIDSKKLKTKCGWTPFEGWKVSGRVKRVVLRGETVYDGENIIGKPRGRVIYQTLQ